MDKGSVEISEKAQEAQGLLQGVTEHNCGMEAVCISTWWGPVEALDNSC